MRSSTPQTVGIFDASADTLDMLSTAVSQQGYRAIRRRSKIRRNGFCRGCSRLGHRAAI